jgi:hypothetical protein
MGKWLLGISALGRSSSVGLMPGTCCGFAERQGGHSRRHGAAKELPRLPRAATGLGTTGGYPGRAERVPAAGIGESAVPSLAPTQAALAAPAKNLLERSMHAGETRAIV